MSGKNNQQLMWQVIHYVTNSDHVPSCAIATGAVYLAHAALHMQLLKEAFNKTGGRQLRQFVLSFGKNDAIDYNTMLWLNKNLALYFGLNYQTVCAVHTNTKYPHIHIVMNTVCYLDGRMYDGGYSTLDKIKKDIQWMCPRLTVVLKIGS